MGREGGGVLRGGGGLPLTRKMAVVISRYQCSSFHSTGMFHR